MVCLNIIIQRRYQSSTFFFNGASTMLNNALMSHPMPFFVGKQRRSRDQFLLSDCGSTDALWIEQHIPFNLLNALINIVEASVGLCKTTKRKDQLYINLLVSVWRIICENFNPKGLILAEI